MIYIAIEPKCESSIYHTVQGAVVIIKLYRSDIGIASVLTTSPNIVILNHKYRHYINDFSFFKYQPYKQIHS